MTDEQALSLRTKMLGATVREARLEAGKSIRESAELLGISSSTFSSYEHGRKGISLPELEVLAHEYRLPLRRFWADRMADEEDEGREFDPEQEIALREKLIGATLRKQRHEADMTIADLADAVGFPSSRVSAYERGERSIPLPELEVLADELGQELEDYIELDGPIGEWIRERRQFRAFLDLPGDLQEFVADPDNRSYLRVAKDLSQLPREELRAVRRSLEEITP
ncbi:MAG: helix-turn-helix transcriptional regulator [Anaerolineales bacterium]|nr:helix-turn-helix transcriptional regulator [Anaerolineales bacterium]